MTVVASNYARVENDLYQTEPFATEALLRHFPIVAGETVWEPFAGNHMMADVMREHGACVFCSDIKTYDRQHDQIFDFINGHMIDRTTIKIITNPAYGKQNIDAARSVRRALERTTGLVAMLLTAKFDFGSTRIDLFRDNPRFAAKITLVDRIQWFPPGEGTEDHAWYVWAPEGERIDGARIIYEGRPSEKNATGRSGRMDREIPRQDAGAGSPGSDQAIPQPRDAAQHPD